jgi:hypothetical protein
LAIGHWLLPLAKKAKPAAGQAGKQKLFAAVIGHWLLLLAGNLS